MIYFLVILAIVIVAIFFVPINIKIYIDPNVQSVDNNHETLKSNYISVTIYVLGFIPIYKYSNKNTKNKRMIKTKFKDLKGAYSKTFKNKEANISNLIKDILNYLKKVKFKKFIMIYGFNTEDYVKNSYINATLNTIICMLINANSKNFNFNNLYYQVSISDYKQYIFLDSIISFPLVNNITTLITIIAFSKNLNKEKNKRLRSDGYVRTSNRKFNDDSNELA